VRVGEKMSSNQTGVLVLSKNRFDENAKEGFYLVTDAIIAGIILYILNRSFLNNVPAYVSIAGGVLLVLYMGRNEIARNLGFALLVDGMYKLIKQYITISS